MDMRLFSSFCLDERVLIYSKCLAYESQGLRGVLGDHAVGICAFLELSEFYLSVELLYVI